MGFDGFDVLDVQHCAKASRRVHVRVCVRKGMQTGRVLRSPAAAASRVRFCQVATYGERRTRPFMRRSGGGRASAAASKEEAAAAAAAVFRSCQCCRASPRRSPSEGRWPGRSVSRPATPSAVSPSWCEPSPRSLPAKQHAAAAALPCSGRRAHPARPSREAQRDSAKRESASGLVGCASMGLFAQPAGASMGFSIGVRGRWRRRLRADLPEGVSRAGEHDRVADHGLLVVEHVRGQHQRDDQPCLIHYKASL